LDSFEKRHTCRKTGSQSHRSKGTSYDSGVANGYTCCDSFPVAGTPPIYGLLLARMCVAALL